MTEVSLASFPCEKDDVCPKDCKYCNLPEKWRGDFEAKWRKRLELTESMKNILSENWENTVIHMIKEVLGDSE